MAVDARSSTSAWAFAERVTRPALLLAPNLIAEVADRLREAGIQAAVAGRDVAPLYDWILRLAALQGISDQVAFGYDAQHGGVTYAVVAAALDRPPSCPRLQSYWQFADCRFRKSSRTCASPNHLPACPLPRLPLRKGVLNQAAYAVFLFVRDLCDDDLVGWIDQRLATADPGVGAPGRAAALRAGLLDPLVNIVGIGPKLWSMLLSELLLAGDPDRERWVATGAGMVAIDSLVHNFLDRTGTLRRLRVEHRYGPACYGPAGCASVIDGLADRIDTRAYDKGYPCTFPRFIQHAIWRFCSVGEIDLCNGRRIDDRTRCRQVLRCPAHRDCDRKSLAGG